MKNKKQRTFTIYDFESAVSRLVGLPKFIGSDRASDRKWGEKEVKRLDSFFYDFIGFNEHEWGGLPDCIDPRHQLGKYWNLIKQQEYEKAELFARQWAKWIREETQGLPNYYRQKNS